MKKGFMVVRIDFYSDKVRHFGFHSSRKKAKKVIKDSLAIRKELKQNPYQYAYEIKKCFSNG